MAHPVHPEDLVYSISRGPRTVRLFPSGGGAQARTLEAEGTPGALEVGNRRIRRRAQEAPVDHDQNLVPLHRLAPLILAGRQMVECRVEICPSGTDSSLDASALMAATGRQSSIILLSWPILPYGLFDVRSFLPREGPHVWIVSSVGFELIRVQGIPLVVRVTSEELRNPFAEVFIRNRIKAPLAEHA